MRSIIRRYHQFLFLPVFILCGIFVACSSSNRGVKGQQPEKVHLTEERQLMYAHNFIEGVKHKMFGDLPTAANLLTRCVEVNPYASAAHFQLAEIYTIVEDWNSALNHARLSVRYEPNNEWYKLQLANLYLNTNDIDNAIAVYRQIVDSQPDNADLRYNMALLYLEKNDYRRALRELDRIEKTYGFTEELVIAKYMLHSRRNDIKATESLLKKAISSFPDELRFYGLLAEMYGMIGRENEADEYYTKLLEADPENALGYISMIEFYKDYGKETKVLEEMQRMYSMKTIDADLKVELFLQLSADTVFFGKYQKELDLMIKELFEKYPDNFRVRIINTDRNMRERNYEGARDDLLFITNRVQTNYQLWEHLLHLLYLLNDYETLYETATVALQYFDDRYLLHFFYGFSASMLKEYENAIPAYYLALELLKKERVPDREIEFQTYVFLGEACNEQKRYAESDHAFESALLIAPNHPIALNNYSYYLSLREEKLELAEKYITRCIAIEPNSSTFLDTYAWVLYKLGRIDEAIEVMKKAIENGGGDNPEILDHYCELLTVAGRFEEAYEICKLAIEINNSEQTVEEKMESFKKN